MKSCLHFIGFLDHQMSKKLTILGSVKESRKETNAVSLFSTVFAGLLLFAL